MVSVKINQKRSKKQVTKDKKAGQRFIQRREKLANKERVTSKEAGGILSKRDREDAANVAEAERRAGERERAETARSPEAIAQKNIDIDTAERKINL